MTTFTYSFFYLLPALVGVLFCALVDGENHAINGLPG